MSWWNATPPTIPGSAALKTEAVETLQVYDDLNVEGAVTCDALASSTTVTAGTGLVAITGGVTATAGNIVATAGNVTATGSSTSTVSGSYVTAQVMLLCGATQAGTVTLTGGTATVGPLPTTVGLLTTDLVFLAKNTPGGTPGYLSAPVGSYNTTARTFVINSTSNSDTSTVNWFLVRPY